MPNVPEESLDISFIDSMSKYSAPKIVSPNWAVRIAAHFIGNIRHRRRYEIADIGVVIVFKNGNKVLARKLVLLQSKRLYPKNNEVIEFDDFDYDLGLGLITGRENIETSIFSNVCFKFDSKSIYGALKARSNQCKVIEEHIGETNIPVHYQFYNPLILPWSISYPITVHERSLPKRQLGVRVLSAEKVHSILKCNDHSTTLRVADLSKDENNSYTFGMSLERFFDDVIRCEEGYIFNSAQDVGLSKLFRRKSGPIFCVVEIVIEEH